jgi:hypothetical protein
MAAVKARMTAVQAKVLDLSKAIMTTDNVIAK